MRDHPIRMFQAGIDACHPRAALPAHLPDVEPERLTVLALGKAAVAMAAVAEARYGPGLRGLAVAPYGTPGSLSSIELVHAGHPIPDLASVEAAERLLAARGEYVLCLLSGGASALACLPVAGLDLAGKRALTEALLRAGAPIGEINCVRRHVSRIKGGRLAADLTLAISDVAGDRPEDIGSGPTVADPSTIADARAILARYGLEAPLEESAESAPGEFRVVANASQALAAIAAEAERLGYQPVLLGECAGEAREIGRRHAERALEVPPGTALISGGELTVNVTGGGLGGPNCEYALAAGLALAGRDDIFGLAADSDGLDGNSGVAGAFIAARSDGEAALAANDSLAAVDPFVTGPTGTNVNDLRIILVNGDSY